MKVFFFCLCLFSSVFHGSSAFAFGSCEGPTGGNPGQCALDFTLKTLDGRDVRLSDYKDKVIFLNFWATWCEPCVAEIPSLIKANEKLSHNKPFVMLTVSIDTEGKEAIDRFYKKHFKGEYPPYPHLMDTNKKISMNYGTFKVPETYIIDKKGVVRDKVEGIRDWEDSLIMHYLELLTQE